MQKLIQRTIACLGHAPDRWLLVDTQSQRLMLMHRDDIVTWWPVSTATAGLDSREGSGGTPPGLHRIAQKIGHGTEGGAVFVSREPTGEMWDGQPDPRDLILGRILTLEGCEEGVNSGRGVDSLARYIYLHGTNHEGRIGEPCSHGCIRLRPDDIVALFDQVEEHDTVVIT